MNEWPWYYIDPETCIDCGACIPECPYEAIFEEEAVPADYSAKGGEYIARPGLQGHYEGKNDQGDDVILDCTKQLEAGETINLTEDIQPNYTYFTEGVGYGALEMQDEAVDLSEVAEDDAAAEKISEEAAVDAIEESDSDAAVDSELEVVGETADQEDEFSEVEEIPEVSSTGIEGAEVEEIGVVEQSSGDEIRVTPAKAEPVWQPPFFLTIGLVRGLLGQLIGTLFGMALVFVIRFFMGLDEFWAAEPAWVVGGITGTLGFMIGVGALTDWGRWMIGIQTPMVHGPPSGKPAWFRYLSVDYNHKVIGIQYTVTGILVMLIGGTLAIIFRLELVATGMQYISYATFNTFVSAHGIIMIVSILLGVGGMVNYLVPLLIGASDMAFPRLNAFGYWINVPGAVLLITALFVGGWDTGWTGYPPLSARAPIGIQLFFLAVYMVGLSSIVGSLNLLVTVARMRPPGMSLFRMPIFVWAAVATALIQLTATQFIGLSFLMVLVERVLGMGYFDPFITEAAVSVGSPPGDPILFQHLFWFYSHPAVYVFILPGLGIISELLPVFARKPLFGYKWIALSSLSIALVGFLVWAHHMFVAGMSDYLRIPFMLATLLVAVPTGVKFFSWLGTMWQGKLTFPTPMLFVLGAISVFLIGGLTGPPNGTVTTDLFLHDTYWVVGHFHATMFGGFVFPFFAALYYWYPKVTGRNYSEKLGKLHFWLMTPAFWVQSVGQSLTGLKGMRRRIADYDPALGIENYQLAITIAGIVIAVSVLVCIYNLWYHARHGETAQDNPWRSRSPEFQIPSPIPEHSYATPFEIVGEPYDYGLPGSVYTSMETVNGMEPEKVLQ
ncbi:MAG: cytochrome C oxidase subunit I [Anaerolineaceae bacterium]|nr:cytochrome C oxidase subunit I [Anaerolineaceae bacterium]|tara:strand:- start:22456 stop:24969 length:2514 start_codon:yes stop_codon:yes gene_type:complete